MANIAFGYCHCGCGRLTSIAKSTVPARGYVQGQPQRFVNGHGIHPRKTGTERIPQFSPIVRRRALAACGHEDWLYCARCKQYDDPTKLQIYCEWKEQTNNYCTRAVHPACNIASAKASRQRRLSQKEGL